MIIDPLSASTPGSPQIFFAKNFVIFSSPPYDNICDSNEALDVDAMTGLAGVALADEAGFACANAGVAISNKPAVTIRFDCTRVETALLTAETDHFSELRILSIVTSCVRIEDLAETASRSANACTCLGSPHSLTRYSAKSRRIGTLLVNASPYNAARQPLLTEAQVFGNEPRERPGLRAHYMLTVGPVWELLNCSHYRKH
jgi:hypothetical protein